MPKENINKNINIKNPEFLNFDIKDLIKESKTYQEEQILYKHKEYRGFYLFQLSEKVTVVICNILNQLKVKQGLPQASIV